MAHEVPIGFDKDGHVIMAWKWTDAELSEIYMANQMYAASPDGKAQVQAFLDSLPDGTLTLAGDK